jgi:arginase family enzyme
VLSTKPTRAFCGLPVVSVSDVPSGTVGAVLGACYSLGSPHRGTENAAFFLRTMSRHFTWAASDPAVFDLGHGVAPLRRIIDLGDLDFRGMTLEGALAATERLVRSLPNDVAPCVIGGDHTVTLAVVRALRARRPRPFQVIQFDHHLDLQIWDAAPARADVNREPVFHTNVMSHVSDCVGPGRLIQVGVSPYVTVEAEATGAMNDYLAGVGRQITVVSPEIDDPDAFRAAVGTGEDVYVTVDVDVLDAAVMAATGYPAEAGGLSMRRLLRLIDLVARHNHVVGFDVVEFAADREDRSKATLADAHRAALIVLHLLSWVGRQPTGPTASAEEVRR